MVGRRCVHFGVRWGCENRGVQVSDYSVCMSRRWRGGAFFSTRGPEDDSVESKHVAPLSHYMFNVTTVVFDGPSPPFTSISVLFYGLYHTLIY